MTNNAKLDTQKDQGGGNTRPQAKSPSEVNFKSLDGIVEGDFPTDEDLARRIRKDRIRQARKIIKKSIDELIALELETANVAYGQFNSMHEGYAVLLEELEEVEDAVGHTKLHFDYLWRLIRSDRPTYKQIREVKKNVLEIIEEAIQVGAMLDKMLPLVEGKE